MMFEVLPGEIEVSPAGVLLWLAAHGDDVCDEGPFGATVFGVLGDVNDGVVAAEDLSTVLAFLLLGSCASAVAIFLLFP